MKAFCAAEESDICKVTKTVLCAVTKSHSHDNRNLNFISNQVTRVFNRKKKKKFFIISDGVQNKNNANYENMSKPFKLGAKGRDSLS